MRENSTTLLRALPWVAVAAVLAIQLLVWQRSGGGPGGGVSQAAPARPGGGELEERVAALEDTVRALAALEARVGSLERGAAIEPVVAETSERVALGADAQAQLEARIARLEGQLGSPEERARARRAARALTAALAQGDEGEVRRLLASGIDPNARDDDRQTPLAAAAIAGNIEMMDLLLASGADLERTAGRRSMTPLLAALDADQEDTMLALLDRGADPGAVDKNGESSLIWASFNGCERAVRRLLDTGVKVDFQSHDGGTALMDAARKGRVDIARLLLESGADPNLRDKNGTSALGFAKKYPELAELLRSHGGE